MGYVRMGRAGEVAIKIYYHRCMTNLFTLVNIAVSSQDMLYTYET